MASVLKSPMLDSTLDVDKLTYEIFSILENKFLFGYQDDPKLSLSKPHQQDITKNTAGKVRILCIDGGSAADTILSANSLAHLESCLRRKSGNPNAHIADYFDVVAGAGVGGILTALLFTPGRNGKDGASTPIFTADQALNFLADNHRPEGIIRRILRRPAKLQKALRKIFGDECTLKDTLKSVLIPCYDLATRAPFLFSRADALETDGFDFKMRDVCLASSADQAVEIASVDRKLKIVAVDGGLAMNNPTAAAITHVLNNKQEFPLCGGVEDVLVVSLGNGESDFGVGNLPSSPAAFARIAGDGASDMVDQAVSMAFGQCRTTNYCRIQANCAVGTKHGGLKKTKKDKLGIAEEMLAQKNLESVLFKGKRMVDSSNLEKLELFAGELIKEQERRKTSILPTVMLKQTTLSSPRTSSSTTLSSMSS